LLDGLPFFAFTETILLCEPTYFFGAN
jgi:hypothetical protein